jgi:predicted transcriptional regulator
MKIREIVNMLNAKVVCGDSHLDDEVEYAFASDLMSDVLTIDKSNFLLISGMVNIQAIRTAEMSDTQSVLFVRNKKVSKEMEEIAKQNDMVIMEYSGSMFRASGILYSAGLKPVY